MQFNSLQITMKNYFIFKSKNQLLNSIILKLLYYVYIVHYVRKTAPGEEEDEISSTLVQSIQLQFDRSKLSEYVGKLP